MPRLSQNDQFKLLREELRDFKTEIRRAGISKYGLQDDVKILKADIRDTQSTIKSLSKQLSAIPELWEKSFFEFRSKLFNKIDGFVGRINTQDQEIGAINARVSRLEEPQIMVT
ncbi:MAG: hypothetical protein UX80_C0025G0004 [Candidatus Amesbacteria bacterium GW2011_GWA2_47_11b]|uniref:Uncharacterized protein n=2 Tax=Candidatus Amesiibacteriota TaxID=1752730 RepID=A0A0G1RJ82_9BACT|nr:MAG: hypothetical protein UX42_C0004G0011 [Microgenomates group bacterium GW2011_GWC1_46_20]KKU57112.1 MAG: hypothetical protein UX80_C0025G0004 [Candidatus Amesbacteria bacterium GW2011_GWA2_47_11b]KKU82760.1 MAG: hypothetical protein UY11_C0039G0004 [Candidatus Amesbacteria bacterium GW2011_GWC2_47_8]